MKILILKDLLEVLATDTDGEFRRKDETIFLRVDKVFYNPNKQIVNSNVASALLSYYVCNGTNNISFKEESHA